MMNETVVEVAGLVGTAISSFTGISLVAVFALLGTLVWLYTDYKRTTAFTFNGKPVFHTPWRPPFNDLLPQMKDIVAFTKKIEQEVVEPSRKGKDSSVSEPNEVFSMATGPFAFLSPFSERLVNLCLSTSEMKLTRNLKSLGVVYRTLKGSIFSTSQEKWHRQHKVLAQLFSLGVVREYRGIIADQAEALIASIEQEVASGGTGTADVEMVSRFTNLTNKIVCDTVFGADIPVESRLTILKAMEEIMRLVVHPLSYFSFTKYLPFLPYVRKQNHYFAILNKETDRVIQERLQCIAEGELQPKCLIDHILLHNEQAADEDKFSPVEIRGNVRAMFIAGTDTTAQALSWTLCHLTRDKREYQKVMRELDSVSFDNDFDDYPVPYAESRLFAAINESLRHTPPTIITGFRDVPQDLTMRGKQGEELFLPKGSRFAVHIYLYHHLKSLWEDPYAYRPDRMLGRFKSPAAAVRDPHFITFGAGRRTCIARYLAYDELMWVLSRLLKKVEFDCDAAEIKPTLQFPMITPGKLVLTCRMRPSSNGNGSVPTTDA